MTFNSTMQTDIRDIDKLADRALLLIVGCGSCVAFAMMFPRDSLVHDVFSLTGYIGFLAYCGGGLGLCARIIRRFPRWALLIIVPPILCLSVAMVLVTQISPDRWDVLSAWLMVGRGVLNGQLVALVSAATYGWTKWCLRPSGTNDRQTDTGLKPYGRTAITDHHGSTTGQLSFVRNVEAVLWFTTSLAGAAFLGFEFFSRADIFLTDVLVSGRGFQIDTPRTHLQFALFVTTLAAGVAARLLRRRRLARLQTQHEQDGPVTIP